MDVFTFHLHQARWALSQCSRISRTVCDSLAKTAQNTHDEVRQSTLKNCQHLLCYYPMMLYEAIPSALTCTHVPVPGWLCFPAACKGLAVRYSI
jgi:hypothetical protein